MRATWTAAALTAALSLTAVSAASADLAFAANTAPASHSRPAAVTPPVGLPTLPDPAKNVAALGALGHVLDTVNSVVVKATPTKAAPDALSLQGLLDQLKALINSLLGLLGLPPLLSAPAVADDAPPRTLPAATGPVAVSPADALANVQKDAAALVAAATAAKPDPAAVKQAIPQLSTDSIAATAATATALTPLP